MRTARQASALALAAVAVLGLSVASAATLTTRSGVLQAGAAVVGTCQPPDRAARVLLDGAPTPSGLLTSGVVVTDVAASCDGRAFRLQVLSTAGAPLDVNGALAGTELTGRVALAGGRLAVAFGAGVAVPAAQVGSVAVVVHG